jgi:hypothetical protein
MNGLIDRGIHELRASKAQPPQALWENLMT